MKSNYFLIFFMLVSGFGFAQTFEIAGLVKEAATDSPIPGANIQLKNAALSTTTDLDGRFTLAGVSSGSVIVVSYVGFNDAEYKVTSSNTAVTIVLQENVRSLDEVVVIGYGTQRRKEVTGAVSVLGARSLEIIKPITAESALQGTVSGVLLTSQGGSPGAGFNFSIRGISSNQNNRPLIIIDGYIGDMSLLNPQDIESITILKDSQAAIYGTQSANGVVLITTKRGKKNTPAVFSYNGYTGFQETTRKLPLLNATEYALILNESYANGGRPIPYPNVSGLGKGTDWQAQIFDQAPIINHDFSISGGSDKVTYMFSGSDLTQEGIIGAEKSSFKRNTARLSVNADLSDKWKIQSNFIYTYFDRDTFNDNALGSVLFNAVNTPATLSPYDANGNFTLVPSTAGLGIEIINPLAQLANTYNDYDFNRLNGTFGLDYEILKDLVVTGRIGVNTETAKGKSFAKMISYGGKVFDVTRSSVTQTEFRRKEYTLDFFLNYKKTISDDHNFAVTAGTTIYKEWGNQLSGTGFDVPNNSWEFADISLAQGQPTSVPVGSFNFDNRRNSQFIRLQYNFREKYLISFMNRRDASTYFGPNNTIAYFPSMTAGWVVSREGFFPQDAFVNFLKFRGSYGIAGNDLIGSNRYSSLLNGEATYVFDDQLVNGSAIGVLANPDVTWEKSKKFDVGADLNLLNNKVEINADYYIHNTAGLLIGNYPVSGTTGVFAPGGGSPTVNAGTTRNTGFELAVTYTDKIGDDFNIGVNYNITTINNEVTDIKGEIPYVEQGGFGVGQPLVPTRMELGQPMGYFYGYQTDGIFQNQAEVNSHPSQTALGASASPGDIRYKDLNGDGVIDPNDRTYLGDPIPDVIMGFNFNLGYKGFDLSAYSYASIGNDLIRNYERTLTDVNRLDYVLDRWTGEGTSNSVPRVTTDATANNVFSDFYVEDASYFRIQKVELGYTINTDFIKRAKIERVRLYAAVNNLYTFTNYKGFDPASTNTGSPISAGIDNGTYPIARTYLFGINLNF